jgi:microcin C transport system substrate-binding protein
VPDEVFGEPYRAAGVRRLGQDRNLLRKAQQLLQARDCRSRTASGCCRTARSSPSSSSSTSHRSSRTMVRSSRISATLGIEATLRVVDAVQFRARVESFDFDITVQRLTMSPTRVDGPARLFHLNRRPRPRGPYNFAGVANPAIDALVEKAMAAETRSDLTFACRAPRPCVPAGRYWVPQWYNTSHRLAYWDLFGHPPKLPRYTGVGGADPVVA